jgi:hypothetical protein
MAITADSLDEADRLAHEGAACARHGAARKYLHPMTVVSVKPAPVCGGLKKWYKVLEEHEASLFEKQ